MNNLFKMAVVSSIVVMLTACGSISTDAELEAPSVNQPEESSPSETQMSDAELEALKTTVFYFGFDSSDLSAEDRSTLVYHAASIKGDASKKIRLEGHASEEGTREYNLALGERRAKSVAMFLIVNGVAASQIEVVSYGEEQPADAASTDAARTKNRRVELK